MYIYYAPLQRVELAEIESVLSTCKGVKMAIVDYRNKTLMAWIVKLENNHQSEKELLKNIQSHARKILAEYMVPSLYFFETNIPYLPNGKINRGKLQARSTSKNLDTKEGKAAKKVEIFSNVGIATTQNLVLKIGENVTQEELFVAKVFTEQLGENKVTSINDSFFELGGHSLLVSRAVTALRKICPSISTRDFYACNGTLSKVAKIVKEKRTTADNPDYKRRAAEQARIHEVRSRKQMCLQLFCADMFQLLALWFFSCLGFLHMYGVILVVLFIFANASFEWLIFWFMIFYVGLIVYSYLLCFTMKWLLIGRYKEGIYPLWGWFHLRWWFVHQLQSVASLGTFNGTCILNYLYKGLGSKIGKSCYLAGQFTSEYDLVELGNGVTLNAEVELKCHSIIDRVLIMKKIKIGNNVTIDSRSIVLGGTIIEDNATIGSFSLIPEDSLISANETWSGSPAVKEEVSLEEGTAQIQPNHFKGFKHKTTLCQLLVILFLACVQITISLPSLYLLSQFMDAMPNSLIENEECRATYYCNGDLLCIQMPEIFVYEGKYTLQPTSKKTCQYVNNAENEYMNLTLTAQAMQSKKDCNKEGCHFPFYYLGGTYSACTSDPSPKGKSEGAWCSMDEHIGVDENSTRYTTCSKRCENSIKYWDNEVYSWREDTYFSYTGLTPYEIAAAVVVLSFSTLFCSLIINWFLILVVKTMRNKEHEKFDINSKEYLLRWFADIVLASSAGVFKPFQGTVFMSSWARCMGGKIGKYVELSSSGLVSTDTLEIAEGAFIADSVVVGVSSVDRGIVSHRTTSLGPRAFVGNGSILNEGSKLEMDCLIALQSKSPLQVEPNSVWVGSPPLKIAAREKSKAHAITNTYRPTCCRYTARASFETFGYLLLVSYYVLFMTMSYLSMDYTYGYFSERNTIALFVITLPVVQLLFGVCLLVLIIITKWIVMCGRYKAGNYPLYSFYVWRIELIERLEENLAEPLILDFLSGTSLKPWFYRCMGVKIGKRPYLEKAILTEADMIEIGDYATIESGGTIQAHLFQDRIRTLKKVKVGNSCSIGSNAVVLLGGELNNNVNLDPLSLIMRDERLPANSCWHGSPAQQRMKG